MTISQFGIYIPATVKAEWSRNAQGRAQNWLVDMLTLRDIIEEHKAKGEQVVMEIYAEAAPAMRKSSRTLQNNMTALRAYSLEQLTRWLVATGLSLDTLKAVNEAASKGYIKTTAAEYMDWLVDHGKGDGSVPTRAEVETLIAEESGRGHEYKTGLAITWFARRLGIDDDGFIAALRELIEKYRLDKN